MPVNFIDDEEDQLPYPKVRPEDDEEDGSFDTGPSAVVPPGPKASPELQRILQTPPPNLGTPPVSQAVTDAQQKLAEAKGKTVALPQPKWWQRLAAGAVGGLAGYANAEGKRAPQIDP